MNPAAARAIAIAAHAGHHRADGEPLVGHLRRVAARVTREAQATAWLHELGEWRGPGEWGGPGVHDLLACGMTPAELGALELLTRAEGEQYDLYVRRIARAPGPAGDLARRVKVADLADDRGRLAASSSWARRYRLAQEQIERRQRRTVAPGPGRRMAA
jgi:hypothetical protein